MTGKGVLIVVRMQVIYDDSGNISGADEPYSGAFSVVKAFGENLVVSQVVTVNRHGENLLVMVRRDRVPLALPAASPIEHMASVRRAVVDKIGGEPALSRRETAYIRRE